jgi:hypothetical protein
MNIFVKGLLALSLVVLGAVEVFCALANNYPAYVAFGILIVLDCALVTALMLDGDTV